MGSSGEAFSNIQKLNPDSERTDTVLPMMITVNSRLESLKNDEAKIKNRVNLLLKEEARIMKKISETRARADEITHIRQRNE